MVPPAKLSRIKAGLGRCRFYRHSGKEPFSRRKPKKTGTGDCSWSPCIGIAIRCTAPTILSVSKPQRTHRRKSGKPGIIRYEHLNGPILLGTQGHSNGGLKLCGSTGIGGRVLPVKNGPQPIQRRMDHGQTRPPGALTRTGDNRLGIGLIGGYDRFCSFTLLLLC